MLPPRLIAAVLAVACTTTAATGQSPPPAGPAPRPPRPTSPTILPLPPGFNPQRAGLEVAPHRFDSLGLTLHLPEGSVAIPERSATGPSVLIQDRASSATWEIRVQALTSHLERPSPMAQMEDQLRRLAASGIPHKVLSNSPVLYRGAPGQMCLVEQTSADNRASIRGWLLMQTDPDRFLSLSMVTLPEHLAGARKAWESSFETMALTSLADLMVERETALERGRFHMATLNEQKLRGLVGTSQWLRLHRPAKNEEIGYNRVEISEAQRGALVPERAPSTYQAAEREQGLLVTLQGRLAVDPAADHYLDWLGMYWVAWDLSSEAWSIRATHRRSSRESSEAETGVRERPDPGAKLMVIRARDRSAARTPFNWVLPEVYLSQAISLIIGRLPPALVAGGEVDLATYAYDGSNDQPSVTLRIDRFREQGGGWEHSYLSINDATPTVASYDASGKLLESREPDGVVTAPIDPKELERLWRSRGLRLGGETGR